MKLETIYIEGPNESANIEFQKELEIVLDGFDLKFKTCEKITHDLNDNEFYCSLKAKIGSTSDMQLRITFIHCLFTLLGISKTSNSDLKKLYKSYCRKLENLYKNNETS